MTFARSCLKLIMMGIEEIRISNARCNCITEEEGATLYNQNYKLAYFKACEPLKATQTLQNVLQAETI